MGVFVIVSCKKDKENEQPQPPAPEQPMTIVSTDIGNAGDIIILKSDTTNLGSYSLQAGENITWDYSNFTSDFLDTLIFYHPSNTPGAQYFSTTSNIAVQPEKGQPLYFYYNKSTDKLEGIGLWADFQGTEVYANYDDKPIYMKFPFKYNDSFTDTAYLTKVINLGSGQGYGKLELTQKYDVKCDASGTIKLPNNKTYKCLREKRKEIFISKIFYSVLPNGPWQLINQTYDTTYTYNYFTKNKKWNVASIRVKDFNSNAIKEIQYLQE